MINFPTHSAFSNNKYLMSTPKPAPQTTLPEKPPAPQASVEPEKKNKGYLKLWAALGAVGILGGVAAGIYRSKKVNVKDTPIDCTELKDKLKKDYLVRKAEVLKDLTASVDTTEIAKYTKMKSDASAAIRTSLTNLQGDKEWNELRNIRKKLLYTFHNSKSDEQVNIADKKLSLVNNLLVCKLHPEEEEAFKGNIFMDIADAKALVKKHFDKFSDYMNEAKSKEKYEFDFNLNERFFYTNHPLALRDLYQDETASYKFAKEKLKELNAAPKKARHEKLKKLAEEFRALNDMKLFKKCSVQPAQTSTTTA